MHPVALRRVLLGLAAVLVVGCGVFVAPSATPGEMNDLIAALVVRGVTVQHLTSGDAGCPGSTLHSNGVHFQVSLSGDAPSIDVYLLRWKSTTDFNGAAADVAGCVAEYQAAHLGSTIDQISLDPWRVYGPNWSPAFKDMLNAALLSVGGGTGGQDDLPPE